MNPLILILLILSTVSIAFGAVEIEDVTFGFNGGYKTGTWVPLHINVRSQGHSTTLVGELAVEVRSFSSDIPIERYTPLRCISALLRHYGKISMFTVRKNATQLVVEFVPRTSSGNTTLRSTPASVIQEGPLPTPLSRKDYFVLVLARSGDKLKQIIDKKGLAVSDNAQVHVEYLPNSNRLPRDWIGYSAVDVLVIRETVLTERSISKAQQTALLDWATAGVARLLCLAVAALALCEVVL